MKHSIELLLHKLEKNHISKHVVCPSAHYLLQSLPAHLPIPIEIIDERSAGYVAVGMCDEVGEPVVIWCSNDNSYRNLAPSLTEAYYRKLPILVVALINGASVNQTINPKDTIRYYADRETSKLNENTIIDVAVECLFNNVQGPVYLPIGLSNKTSLCSGEALHTDRPIDISAIIDILPNDACIHIGKSLCCDIEHLNEMILREHHCSKDGNLSMLIGSSLMIQEQLHIGVFSYDEVTYDMNMLGNRHVGNNVVVLSIKHNNHSMAIFNYASRLSWNCKMVLREQLDTLRDSFVIADKPQYIEVTV